MTAACGPPICAPPGPYCALARPAQRNYEASAKASKGYRRGQLERQRPLHPVTHPDSGVTIHVLTQRVARAAGLLFRERLHVRRRRYLWFYCAFPPALHRSLAVIDLVDQEVRHFPETNAKAHAWTGDGRRVLVRRDDRVAPRAEADDAPVYVNELPAELVGDAPWPVWPVT
ncbi:MAG: hypothetical protein R3A10_11485 [Caldilineaceae bacterium]